MTSVFAPVHRTYAAVIIVILNALDLIITRELLSRGAVEANPVSNIFINKWWAWIPKLGLPILLVWVTLKIPPSRWTVVAACGVAVIYACVVGWNFGLLIGA